MVNGGDDGSLLSSTSGPVLQSNSVSSISLIIQDEVSSLWGLSKASALSLRSPTAQGTQPTAAGVDRVVAFCANRVNVAHGEIR